MSAPNDMTNPLIKEKVKKALLYLGIISMLMLFTGLTSGYVVRMGDGNWLIFELPAILWFSSAVILLSSVPMQWAVVSAKNDNQQHLKTAMLITLLFGIAFIVCQVKAWGTLIEQKIFFTGPGSNASGQFLYVLSALHLAHLVGGIIALFVVWIKSRKGKYTSENMFGVKLCAIYWHFLDFLWIYLFLFIYFINK